MMTVHGLIQELSKYDPDTPVVINELFDYRAEDNAVESVLLVKTFLGNSTKLEYCVRLST